MKISEIIFGSVSKIQPSVLSTKLNEEIWAYPSTTDKIILFKKIMSSPLTPELAKTQLKNVLSSKMLFDILDAETNNDDVRPIIAEYISVQFPELYTELSGHDDCTQCDGLYSVLGH